MKMKIIRMATVILFGLLASMAAAQTFTRRPTAFNSGGWSPYVTPTNAYDNNSTTAATASVQQVGVGSKGQQEIWYAFPSAPSGASGMQLNITSAAQETMPACLSAECSAEIQFDLGDGHGWQPVYIMEGVASRAKQTDVILLDDTQDLTKVRVLAVALADNPGGGTIRTQQQVYEIWISGNQ